MGPFIKTTIILIRDKPIKKHDRQSFFKAI